MVEYNPKAMCDCGHSRGGGVHFGQYCQSECAYTSCNCVKFQPVPIEHSSYVTFPADAPVIWETEMRPVINTVAADAAGPPAVHNHMAFGGCESVDRIGCPRDWLVKSLTIEAHSDELSPTTENCPVIRIKLTKDILDKVMTLS